MVVYLEAFVPNVLRLGFVDSSEDSRELLGNNVSKSLYCG